MRTYEDMSSPGSVAEVDDWVLSPDGRFRVSFTDIGEGRCGDYDPDDPDDARLLRFDVQSNDPDFVSCDDPAEWADGENPTWFWVADGSYCTQVAADAVTGEQLAQLLCRLALEVDGETGSLKKLLERLSWTSIATLSA